MKNIIKNILIYLAGFMTAVILFTIIGQSDSSPNINTTRQGLTIFQKEGNPINETQFKVIQVLEPNLALANGKGTGMTSVFTGITVLLMGDEGKYFYDDEIIEFSSNPKQAGSFQYESKNGRKTVPVIRIK